MRTAQDVLDVIEEQINEHRLVAGPAAVEALVDPVDREGYREAIRRATELRAMERLYRILKARVELFNGDDDPPKTGRKRRAKNK